MSYEREALKTFILNYYKTHSSNTTITEDELNMDIDDFFTLNDNVHEMEVDENLSETAFYNELYQFVDKVATDKEFFVFDMITKGMPFDEIGRIIRIKGKRGVLRILDILLDKIVKESV